MPERIEIAVRPQAAPDGPEGWLVLSGGAPVGFVAGTGIHTPGGAWYAAAPGEMRDADGRTVARLGERHVSDDVSGVTWELKPDWVSLAQEAADGSLGLNVWDAFARAYSLEDAQGSVPVRVRLMMAWEMVRQRRREVRHGGLN